MDRKLALVLVGLAILLVFQAPYCVKSDEELELEDTDEQVRTNEIPKSDESPINDDDNPEAPSTAELIADGLLVASRAAQAPEGALEEPSGADRDGHLGGPVVSVGGLDLSNGLENKWTPTRLIFGLYYGRQYAQLNKNLVEAEPTTDFAANMRKANELLGAELAKGVGLGNRGRVEALEQLVALDTIGRRCDLLGYIVLWRNNKATRGQAHKRPSEFSPTPTRINLLVHKASLLHAIDCLPRYLGQLDRVRAALEPKLVAQVEKFTGLLVDNNQQASRRLNTMAHQQLAKFPFDAVQSVYNLHTLLDTRQLAHIAYWSLRELAADDPDRQHLALTVDEKTGKPMVDGAKVKSLVDRHLVEPCRVYIDALGPDVFIPTKFDSRMLEKDDLFTWTMGDDSAPFKFLKIWISYRFCHLLVFKESEQLTRLVSGFIRAKKF